jgi:hypothetical protein
MTYREMFFVQTFGLTTKNKLVPGRIVPAIDANHASRLAGLISEHHAGVLAFSQMVDEAADDAQEPVLLARYGAVPPEARAAAA